MVRLFSNSEYIDIVLACGKVSGVLLESSEFPCYFFLWGYMRDLVYSITIDTIEVLRERVENAARIRNNRGMLEGVEKSFRWRLHYHIIDSNGGHFEHFL
jgi:hypothetical protein